MRLRTTVLISTLLAFASSGSAAQPNFKCEIGPVEREVGSTNWLDYSCDDHQSLIFVSAPESPASPFYFFLNKEGEKRKLTGESTGTQAASRAAYEDLSEFTEIDLQNLLNETKAAKP